MPTFGPIKRQDLIRYLREFGFEGHYIGGKHQYMVEGERRLVIPNPHGGDVSSVRAVGSGFLLLTSDFYSLALAVHFLLITRHWLLVTPKNVER